MIAIIAAMEQEIEILRSRMAVRDTRTLAGQTYWAGTLAGAEAVLALCGIGKVNAAVGAAFMIDRFHPEVLINTGSAGGLGPDQSCGDIVLSTALRHHDVDVQAFGYEPGQVPKLPAAFEADRMLLKAAQDAASRLSGQGVLPPELVVHSGEIGSGDQFIHDPEHIATIRALFPAMRAVEMEGASIAQVCFQMHVPFLVVRALSDIAGKESPLLFNEFLPLAARHSSALVMELLGAWSSAPDSAANKHSHSQSVSLE